MSYPFISVCLPVYNGQQFLLQAIQSVLNQRFSDYEIVIGDDASTDNTATIARSFINNKIRILTFPNNVGLAGNWNRTIAAAKGRYIKYLAQDDLLQPDCLLRFSERAIEHQIPSFLFCANEQIDLHERHLRWRSPQLRPGRLQSSELLHHLLRHGNHIGGPTNTLICAKAISTVGWFDPRCKFSLDWLMWIELAARDGAVYLPDFLVRVREHGGSETLRLSRQGKIWSDSYNALRILRNHQPELIPLLNTSRAAFLAKLPKIALKQAINHGKFPLNELRFALQIISEGIW